PTDADLVNRIVTSGATADATVRMRLTNDRYMNLSGNLATNRTLQGVANSQGSKAEGRWFQGAWALDANISDGVQLQKFASRPGVAPYDERSDNRQASATLQRQLGRRLTGKLTTSVGLPQPRPHAVGASTPPSTPRDSYRQSYRVEG